MIYDSCIARAGEMGEVSGAYTTSKMASGTKASFLVRLPGHCGKRGEKQIALSDYEWLLCHKIRLSIICQDPC